ncbi:MAG: 3'-5' exonuclease domain-containing protein 2 [Bacteroidales bacterium]|nr:3'-5' exonuclease domain-containing protein 2 [Bacteroidales bacterium]
MNNILIKKSISNDELFQLPLDNFKGDIMLIDNDEKAIYAISYLKNQTLLGFDTETRPTFKKGKKNKVALLQLATSERAFIFRLNYIGLPKELTEIFEDKNIKKVGVAIKRDIVELQELRHFIPDSFVELQDYVKEFGIENFGIKKLTGLLLNFRISKSQQTSNWENIKLSEAQKKYAATDAWVCYLIYQNLEIKRNN